MWLPFPDLVLLRRSQELASAIIKGAAGAGSEQRFLVTESLEPAKAALQQYFCKTNINLLTRKQTAIAVTLLH